MPPKHINPTNKDLDDAIQAATQQLNADINTTNNRSTEQLTIINSKLDN
jgi:hypothetical protein